MTQTSPVIILHGWSLDSNKAQKWQEFRDALGQNGIESEIFKIPGLSAPLDEVWSLDDYVRWLDQEISAKFPNQTIILLGHSFGGQIASRYAAVHPQKVQKLILIDSSGIRDHSLLPTLKRTSFLTAAKIGKVFFQSQAMRNLLYKLARERDYQQAPPLLRRTMSKILDDEVLADLPRIDCPTLLIWGQDDRVTPLSLGKVFQQKISHSQLELVNGARHSPQYTHPQQVAHLIQNFLIQNDTGHPAVAGGKEDK